MKIYVILTYEFSDNFKQSNRMNETLNMFIKKNISKRTSKCKVEVIVLSKQFLCGEELFFVVKLLIN